MCKRNKMIRKKIPEKKLRKNTTSLVRIGDEFIKIAIQIQKEKKSRSIGDVFEQCVLYYKNSL